MLEKQPAREVIFLIDEIEAHLHPQWQRRVIPALLDVISVLTKSKKKIPVQLVVETHSPLVMASAEPFFDPGEDAWFDLDLRPLPGGTTVELTRRVWTLHGTVGNWLTSEAFDLRTERGSIEAEEAIVAARGLLTLPNTPLRQVMSVHAQLRKALPDVDPFWVRWNAFVERQGGQP